MTFWHFFGIFLVFLLIIIIGYLTGRKADGKSFSGEKTSGALIVTGALMGTMVGGSSTIGTAQLAYSFGFSAWWYTLGGGIGVLILGILFRGKFYDQGMKTLPELLEKEYGKRPASLAIIFNSLGTFLAVVAQIISACALITTMASVSPILAVLITIVLIIIYVVFGGALSIGYAGTAKMLLITGSLSACGILAILKQGGIHVFWNSLEHSQFFSLVARGVFVDLGSGLSLIVGILTTQSYISAVVMSKDKKVLTIGTVLTGLLVPLIGVLGIFVGMYMRLNYPGIDSKMALPMFILEHMPAPIAGVMLGALLLAVIGTAAGLSFGIAKMVVRNFAAKLQRNEMFVSRLLVIVVLIIAGGLSLGESGSLILSWSFTSLALRGAAAFVPLISALLFSGKVPSKAATAAVIAGPIVTIVGKFIIPSTIDSLFAGIAAAILIEIIGAAAARK